MTLEISVVYRTFLTYHSSLHALGQEMLICYHGLDRDDPQRLFADSDWPGDQLLLRYGVFNAQIR